MPIFESLRRILGLHCSEGRTHQQERDFDPRWLAVQEKLKASKRIIDLGCGGSPVQGASVAVDMYMEPSERALGAGPSIDIDKMKEKGIDFINSRIDVTLPFEEGTFDFAYSHHVFEHLEDPAKACQEMMRIAKSGVIITPSVFSELAFGRSYHRWMVMDRDNTIFFFRKRPFEDRPFGEHPRWEKKRRNWVVEKDTNPFDILLNDGDWYRGKERLPRLSNILRAHWYSHSPLTNVMFLWDGKFEYKIYE